MEAWPTPGGAEAVARGCLCPTMRPVGPPPPPDPSEDADDGLGAPAPKERQAPLAPNDGSVTARNCPLHGTEPHDRCPHFVRVSIEGTPLVVLRCWLWDGHRGPLCRTPDPRGYVVSSRPLLESGEPYFEMTANDVVESGPSTPRRRRWWRLWRS